MVFEPLESWQLGAHATPAQDLAPKGTFAFGENTVLQHNTGASAIIAQREGWSLQTVLPQSGAPKIIGQYDFVRTLSTAPAVSMHLAVGSNGRFDKMPTTLVLEAADPGVPVPFTPGVYPPSFATMKNFCFIANGMDPLKVFNGTKIYNAGMVAPPPPTTGSAGGSLPAGGYSLVVTYYDAASGLESSASPPTEVTLAATGGINVAWTVYAGAHPITHTRVYLRQDAKQTEHFLVAEVAHPGNGVVLSFTQDQLDAFTIVAPDEDENDPPPVGLIGIEAHVSRMFGHNGSRVFYSNLDSPEAWDPDNSFSVNTDDGSRITALFAAHEVLIIFKRDAVWALYGEDPATWTPRMISPSVGCINERSIMYMEGQSYWWSERGPMAWGGSGPVENLAVGRIDDQITFEVGMSTLAATPNPDLGYVGVVGAVDIVNQRLLWAIPGVNSKQNNYILPFKYRFNQWEATRWTGMDAASLATVQDILSTPHVYLGGYKGQIFKYGGSWNDGTPGGLVEGKVASATLTTLTVDLAASGGSLLTTGGGLSERYLYLNDGISTDWQIKRIASNTADTFTLAPGEEWSLIPNNVWNWSVGTIGFLAVMPWAAFTSPFIRKRLEYGYFWVGATVNASEMEVELFRDYNFEDTVRHFKLDLRSTGLIWDSGKWDKAVWGSGRATTKVRRRLAKVCFSYRWLFRQYKPHADALIYKVDTRAETQVDKR